MSIRVMTAVWDHADVSGGELLVLLALADWANDDGHRCFPLQDTLAKKARMTDRGVRKCLAGLSEKGYIRRERRLGGGPVEWSIHPTKQRPELSSDRNPSSGLTGTPVPTEPLGNRQEEEVSIETSSSEAPSTTSEPAQSNVKGMVPSAVSRETGRLAPGSVRLCTRLAELIQARDPKAKVAPDSVRWLEAADRLMRIDERHFEEALAVLEWCQADPFEQTVVLSMPKFRERYTALRAKWQGARGQHAAVAPQASVADLVSAYERPRSRTGIA